MHDQDKVSEFVSNLMLGKRKQAIYGTLFGNLRRRIDKHINKENEE